MTDPHERRLASWAKQGKPGSTPRPAATVVLLRDHDGLETLMLRKNSKIAFGGMWVFPGGRVDEDDRAGLDGGDDLGAARRAAVREAEEEAGLQVREEALVPFAHWTPPPITPKRFLTWFFLAPAPGGDVSIDEGEIHDHQWVRPGEALAQRDRKEIELAPPTWVTLHELARARDLADALRAAGEREPEHYITRIGMQDGDPVALWHGDAGYEASDAQAPGARHRLSMRGSLWRYERSDETR